MIEIRFQLPDPRRRLAAVRLAHELRDRLPHELTRRGRAWELTAPAPDVARFEYQFELIDAKGTERVDRRPGEPEDGERARGARSRCGRSPATQPPAWLDAEPLGERRGP